MSGMWPADIQCVVTLGIDLDGQSSWIGRNPAFAGRPVLMTMGDYGPNVGASRILGMLDDYDIKASFFIPGFIAERYGDLVQDILSRGHEVAGHGYLHKRPGEISLDEELEELDRGISVLEGLTGEKVKGYRVPSCDPSNHTMSLLAERGFLYDSSLMDDDAPYILNTPSGDLIEIPTHWVLGDFPYYAFAPHAGIRGPMASPLSVFRTWAAEFDGIYKEGNCLALVLHPQVSGHPSRLAGLERLIRHVRSHPNAAFMRAVDIAQYWAGQRE